MPFCKYQNHKDDISAHAQRAKTKNNSCLGDSAWMALKNFGRICRNITRRSDAESQVGSYHHLPQTLQSIMQKIQLFVTYPISWYNLETQLFIGKHFLQSDFVHFITYMYKTWSLLITKLFHLFFFLLHLGGTFVSKRIDRFDFILFFFFFSIFVTFIFLYYSTLLFWSVDFKCNLYFEQNLLYFGRQKKRRQKYERVECFNDYLTAELKRQMRISIY